MFGVSREREKMAKSKVSQMTEFLKPAYHFETGPRADLGIYHAAKAIINANRRVGTDRRASEMRRLLKPFNIMLSYQPSINGPIRLYSPDTNSEWIMEA